MSVITIKWLEDSNECETCGSNYATGAVVSMDDEPMLTFLPVARCDEPESWSCTDVMRAIIAKLGHTLMEKMG